MARDFPCQKGTICLGRTGFLSLDDLSSASLMSVACHFLRDIKVAMARGIHLFPSRTEKLSPVTPMVLRKSGRVGSRRFLERGELSVRGRLPFFRALGEGAHRSPGSLSHPLSPPSASRGLPGCLSGFPQAPPSRTRHPLVPFAVILLMQGTPLLSNSDRGPQGA